MKSRRRIAFLKAQDHANCIDDYSRDLRPAEWGPAVILRATMLRIECPLWVKSGHCGMSTSCPLYSSKQTFAAVISMSVDSKAN
jgi:hypothetical protein